MMAMEIVPSAMAGYKVAFLALLLIFILNLRKSDQICDNYQPDSKFIRCESLEDLYNYKGSSETFSLNPSENRSNFQELRPIHIPNAAAIKKLGLSSVINNFKSEAFKDLVNLEELNLLDNVLYTISKSMFTDLKIKSLLLHDCHINNIETGSFAGLTEIYYLSVVGNNIPNIKKGIFNNLRNLHTFVLTKNRIANIEIGAFEDLPNLTNIYLSGNYLKQIFLQDYLTFKYLPKLELIVIKDGIISEITGYMLEGLTNLQYLYLPSNKISFIEPSAFGETPKLKYLELSNNKLQEIDGHIFSQQGLPFLEYIKLDYNQLTFLSTTFLYKLKGLKSIRIGGNPWQCKCLDIIINWTVNQNVSFECDNIFFDGSRPVCVVPEDGNSCVYKYDPQLYKHFHKVRSFYTETYC